MMPFSFFVNTNLFTPISSSETVNTAIRQREKDANRE